MAVLTMSDVELKRFDTLRRVDSGDLSFADAAGLLGISERHVFRLMERLRSGGVAALAGGALYWLGKDRIVAAFHAVRNRFRNTRGGEEFDSDNPDPEEQEQTP